MNTIQKLEIWLFPPQTEIEQLESEIITNKKFILMVTIASVYIAVMRLLFL